jgi:acetylornithine deacetylase
MGTSNAELEALLSRLVSIDSVNPDLVPGARGEAEIAACVAEWLRARGLEVTLQDTGRSGRANVIATARGAGGGRRLMLNAHMDTVGAAGMRSPFEPHTRDGKLFGRGAMDTKGALAAFMCAAADVRDMGLRGDLILTAVVDEEYASVGTEAVVRDLKAGRLRADAAIVGEPSGLHIVTEHKGFVWFEIETTGVAAHGSLPAVGVDAIAAMGAVLVALEAESARLADATPHRSLGTGSIHASLISGGQELSSYPGSCLLQLERRTVPGETPQSAEAELGAMLERIRRERPHFRAALRRTFSRNPMEADRGSPVVAALSTQVRRVTGSPPVFSGMSGWLDSALLDGAGIPTVVLGPGGEGLHGVEEWVDLDSVRACREIVTAAAADFCG